MSTSKNPAMLRQNPIKIYAIYKNTEVEIKGKTKSLASNHSKKLTVL